MAGRGWGFRLIKWGLVPKLIRLLHAMRVMYKLARTIDSWGNRIDSPGSGEMRVAKDNAPTVLDRNAKVSYELLSIHEH